MPSHNLNIREDLDNQLEAIKNHHKNISTDIEQYVVNASDDLPNFGNIQVYDYDKDIQIFNQSSLDLIDSMAKMFLKELPDLLESDYVKQKIKEDAKYYSNTQLVQKMSEKLLLQQLRQIDQGDNTPKMYEVANQTISQIVANNKDGRNARSEIEKLYKDLRKDFGGSEVLGDNKKEDNSLEKEDDTTIFDTFKLNDAIEKANKNKNK